MLKELAFARKALEEFKQTLRVLRQKQRAVLSDFLRELEKEKLERVRKQLKT